MPTNPRTILIIEDDESLLEAIDHEFRTRGFETRLARLASEALSLLEINPDIQVIWLDHYLLGKVNGLDFVAQIKNHPSWRNIPVFVVSNSSGAESVRSYLRLGVNQYYTKADYDLTQIVADIEHELESKSHQ